MAELSIHHDLYTCESNVHLSFVCLSIQKVASGKLNVGLDIVHYSHHACPLGFLHEEDTISGLKVL